MPLNASSPKILHILQNITLILIAAIFTPLITVIVVLSEASSVFLTTSKRPKFQSCPAPKTVLVTGLGMSKGLTIARSFHKAGHRVIGADFEPYYIPVSGRFSRSLSKFYRVTRPEPGSGVDGAQKYADELVRIIKAEGNVDLWVSCSGVASAVEDGLAKETVERLTTCKGVQFDADVMATLHEKDSFIENTKRLGLNVPDTKLIVSTADALSVLYPNYSVAEKQYILKFVGTDDTIRADMTLLPRPSKATTQAHLAKANPSAARPFVLQQYISGPEFCTHAIIIRGAVKAFTACPSSELLMHYRAMSPSSALFQAFLKYTQVYASKMGDTFTGHFSIDFMVDIDAASGVVEDPEELMLKIYPIECNPRAHTAAVLFADQSAELAAAYLSALDAKGSEQKLKASIVIPPSTTPSYYWIGHDIISLILLPTASLLTLQPESSFISVVKGWMEFGEHLLWWRDGTYEVWDPWPFWWLYVVYWPGMFWAAILTGTWWSRCNVSTTKMFRC